MVSLKLTTLLALATTALTQKCGFRLPDCKDPLVCLPDDPTCAVYGACSGTCSKPLPEYIPCGNPDRPTVRCPPNMQCLPDPRSLYWPEPGICVDVAGAQACKVDDKESGCPKYQACYEVEGKYCGDSAEVAVKTCGICMYKKPMEP